MSRSLGVVSAAASAVSSGLHSGGLDVDSSSSSDAGLPFGRLIAEDPSFDLPTSLMANAPTSQRDGSKKKTSPKSSDIDQKTEWEEKKETIGHTSSGHSSSSDGSNTSWSSQNLSGSSSSSLSSKNRKRKRKGKGNEKRVGKSKYNNNNKNKENEKNSNEDGRPLIRNDDAHDYSANPYCCARPLTTIHVLEFYLNKSQWMFATPYFPSLSPDPLYRKSTDEGTFASTNRVIYSQLVRSHHVDVKAIDIVIDECNRVVRSLMWFPHFVYLVPWLCIPLGLVVYVVESGHRHQQRAFQASLVFLVGGIGGLMFAMRLWRARWLRVLELLTETLDAFNVDFEELDIRWDIQCDVPVLAGRSYGRSYYKLKMMLGHRHYHRLKLQYDRFLERKRNRQWSLTTDDDLREEMSILESRTVTRKDYSISRQNPYQPVSHKIDYSARFSVDSAHTILSDDSVGHQQIPRKKSSSSVPVSGTGVESIRGVAPIQADLASMMSPIPTLGSETPTLKRTVTGRFYKSGFVERAALPLRKQGSSKRS